MKITYDGIFIGSVEFGSTEEIHMLCELHSNFVKLTEEEFVIDYDLVQSEMEFNSELNKVRSVKAKNIKVTNNKISFDGDEISQQRMARKLLTLDAKEKVTWIDAEGNPKIISKEILKDILKQSSEKQTEIFIEYAEKKKALKEA